MMDFHMLIVIGFGGGCFAANNTLERSFAGMRSLVFGQVVSSMKHFAAVLAPESLRLFMFSGMSQPIVFAGELAAAMIACVWLYRFVGVHVRRILGLPDKCFRTHVTLERFRGAARMYPFVLLQIPFGGETFIAYRTAVLYFAGVRCDVCLQT